MSTPIETAAEALTDLHYGHQDEEGYAELVQEGVFRKDAEAALASLAQHRDDIAREIAHQTEVPQELAFNAADAVLAFLTGGAS